MQALLGNTVLGFLIGLAALAVVAERPALAQRYRDFSAIEAASAVEQALVGAIARAEPSVVAIARVKADDSQFSASRRDDLLEGMRQTVNQSSPRDPDFIPNQFGTGVVIDRKGLILTHYNVVRAGDEHWVTTPERKVYRADLVAADPRSRLAVLKIDATDLVPITFGDAAKLRKGQIVVALGNPYAIARDGQVSASWGIVSNIARKAGLISSSDPLARRQSLHHFGTLIQTDAKLNLGTSGGALVNLQGEMVGLTTSLAATAGFESAAGYAVPIDETFRRVVDVLKEGREAEYGLLGVRPENLHPDDIREGKQGMRVRDIIEATPAAQYGILPNDIITHVNGKPIYDADGLVLEIGRLAAGATARLTVRRGGAEKQIEVKLAKYPVPGTKVITQNPAAWRGLSVDFSTAIEQYEMHARMGDVDQLGCVVITQVEQGSPSWNAGLRPHMFISHVEGTRVSCPQDFYNAVAGRQSAIRVRLTLPEDQQPVRTIPAAS